MQTSMDITYLTSCIEYINGAKDSSMCIMNLTHFGMIYRLNYMNYIEYIVSALAGIATYLAYLTVSNTNLHKY